ncbi:hypothetical protein [Methylobacterium soli]|jgi:hypothetical protein|uniref:Uncharacterized protein n=1 Tax=Methylobacterium soli TaxID=553447 RepID=A0A6L3T2Y5_9HYPH|nr:hypothetical protein [Methylobacterium soli]KAB1079540.1 hypothetical protein F6X53_09590 [Methylobacterium soli]GJE42027.1 hypothetical protein AEGHOMDF_1197 [Methylobacterium soli]
MSDVIKHDFGKGSRASTRRLTDQMRTARGIEAELQKDPTRLFHLACEEIIELNAEIKRAQDALAVGPPLTEAERVSVDPQELENLRTCAAIVSAIKVLG